MDRGKCRFDTRHQIQDGPEEDPDGRQRKATFAKQSEAKRHAAAMEADNARGQYIDGDDRTTVTTAAWAWLARRSVRDGTHERLASLIRCHIEAVPLGARRLAAVRPSEVHAWATDRGKVLAPATMRKLVGTLKSVCADAVLDRTIGSNPVAGVRRRLPSVTRERVVPLTIEQVIHLADTVPPRYRAMMLTQGGLGLRIGELLGLRITDIDFLRRVVRVEPQSHSVTRELVQPKTASSRRIIPLPAMVADALAAHLAQYPAGPDIECTCPGNTGCSRRSASGLVFHTAGGTALDQDYYGRRIFGAAVRRAELPTGTSTHAMRHHFASVLLAAGESVVAVAEWLGHDNATLVLTTYGHLMANSEDRMRKAIDTAYATVADSCASMVPKRSSIMP